MTRVVSYANLRDVALRGEHRSRGGFCPSRQSVTAMGRMGRNWDEVRGSPGTSWKVAHPLEARGYGLPTSGGEARIAARAI